MRFNRTGKKNRVSYRVVLQEHTVAPNKRHVEILGSYDPHTKTAILKNDRIQHWLKEGVQMSDAVYNLFVGQGLVQGEKRTKKMPRPVKEEQPAAESTEAEVVDATEEAPAESASEDASVETPQEEVPAQTEESQA